MTDIETPTAPRTITLADGQVFDIQTRNGTEVIWVPCWKCSGRGYIRGYEFSDGARCWTCHTAAGKFVELAKVVRNAKQRVARRAKAARVAELEAQRAAAGLEAFRANHPTLAFLADDLTGVVVWDNGTPSIHHILLDLSTKLRQSGSLSSKQIEMATRIQTEQAEREAERAAERAAAAPAPTGRVQITGEVLMVKAYDGEYGTTWKMLVKADAGYKVFVTIPRDLELDDLPRGARVQFTATLTPSEDDPTFAKGKRPAKAEIIGGAA